MEVTIRKLYSLENNGEKLPTNISSYDAQRSIGINTPIIRGVETVMFVVEKMIFNNNDCINLPKVLERLEIPYVSKSIDTLLEGDLNGGNILYNQKIRKYQDYLVENATNISTIGNNYSLRKGLTIKIQYLSRKLNIKIPTAISWDLKTSLLLKYLRELERA